MIVDLVFPLIDEIFISRLELNQKKSGKIKFFQLHKSFAQHLNLPLTFIITAVNLSIATLVGKLRQLEKAYFRNTSLKNQRHYIEFHRCCMVYRRYGFNKMHKIKEKKQTYK